MDLPKRIATSDLWIMRMIAKLQKLISDRGLTQTGFEPMVGLPANRISKWAGGQGEPTGRQVLRMAKALNVPVEYLLDDEMEEPPDASIAEAEKKVWEIVKLIGPEAAWKRLVGGQYFGEPPRFLPPPSHQKKNTGA